MQAAEYLILAVTLFAAAGLQGAIGFGAGLVAAPVVGILAPELLPAFIICLGALIGLMVTIRERASLDLKGAGWALAGRIPGSLLGTWLVVVLPLTALTWAVALSVLAGEVSGAVLSTLGWMSPVVLAGFLLSRWINKFMDKQRLRWAALGASVLGSLLLVIRLLAG